MDSPFPPPIDDELLLFIVDDCPSMAMEHFAGRNFLDRRTLDYRALADFFESEWERRSNGK